MIASFFRNNRALSLRLFSSAPYSFNIPGLKIVPSKPVEVLKGPQITPLTFYPLQEKYKLEKRKEYKSKVEDIRYSSQKLAECAKYIQGQPLEDAVLRLDLIKRKGGAILMEAINELRKQIEEQKGKKELVTIKHAIVGKAYRSKKIDIKGKGRHGLIQRPKTSLTLIAEEKTPADAYEDAVKGKVPKSQAVALRALLFQQNSNFNRFKQYFHVISGRGQRERRTKLFRLVNKAQRDLKQQSVHLSRRVIERRLVERLRAKFLDQGTEMTEVSTESTLIDRMAHFEKTYQKKL